MVPVASEGYSDCFQLIGLESSRSEQFIKTVPEIQFCLLKEIALTHFKQLLRVFYDDISVHHNFNYIFRLSL